MKTKFEKYSNLICVEISCFGVPETSLWSEYVNKLVEEYGQIKEVNFRDKVNGWKNY